MINHGDYYYYFRYYFRHWCNLVQLLSADGEILLIIIIIIIWDDIVNQTRLLLNHPQFGRKWLLIFIIIDIAS
jgi:hypothetical protein